MALRVAEQRDGMSDASFAQNMAFITKETQSREEYLAKVTRAPELSLDPNGGISIEKYLNQDSNA